MNHAVRRHLQLDIENYDETIRKFIPGYDLMLERAAQEIVRTAPRRVVDLGAGTGALAEIVLQQCQVSVVELVDVDDEMLARAQIRLKAFGSRVRLRRQSFHDPIPECHAAAASLSLHHVPDMVAKQGLYGRIFDALAPAGVLVNADVTMPEKASDRDCALRGLGSSSGVLRHP